MLKNSTHHYSPLGQEIAIHLQTRKGEFINHIIHVLKFSFSEEIAEEIVSTLGMKFLEGRVNEKLETESDFNKYIHRCLYNASITHYKKSKKMDYFSASSNENKIERIISYGEDQISPQALTARKAGKRVGEIRRLTELERQMNNEAIIFAGLSPCSLEDLDTDIKEWARYLRKLNKVTTKCEINPIFKENLVLHLETVFPDRGFKETLDILKNQRDNP